MTISRPKFKRPKGFAASMGTSDDNPVSPKGDRYSLHGMSPEDAIRRMFATKLESQRGLQQITFKCTDDTFGMPSPHIPDGSFIILVQDGQALVGRYEEPRPPLKPSPRFDHPANVSELAAEAMHIVLESFPDIDQHGTPAVFTCPPELASRAIWLRLHRE